MYKILVQENATLLAIVRKISFQGRGKLPQVWLCFLYIVTRKSTLSPNENQACATDAKDNI